MNLSVIIPNLNSRVIHDTLAALERQVGVGPDVEVIVVGRDEPGLVRQSALVRFVDTGKPVNAAAARNIGIGQSTGEIICFLDADCVARADWLRRIRERFADGSVDVLGGGVETAATGYWPLCEHISSFHEYLVSAPAGMREQLPTLNLSLRRTAQEAAGRFDEGIAPTEDSYFTTRLRLAGYVLRFDPLIAVEHRPERRTLAEVLRHEWLHGMRSIKMDPRWWGALGTPALLRHRGLLLLCSPLIALGTTAKAYAADRKLLRWWHAAPGVYLLKLAWCWGAQEALGANRTSAEVAGP